MRHHGKLYQLSEGIPRTKCGGGRYGSMHQPRVAAMGLQEAEGTSIWRQVHGIPSPQARHEGIPRASPGPTRGGGTLLRVWASVISFLGPLSFLASPLLCSVCFFFIGLPSGCSPPGGGAGGLGLFLGGLGGGGFWVGLGGFGLGSS